MEFKMEENKETTAKTRFKIKDNKAIIISKVNRARLLENWNQDLLTEEDLNTLIKTKMKIAKCSELEATELLKKELVR